MLRAQRRDYAQCEVKTCAGDLSKDVWKTASAFANTDGGTLVFRCE
ncbi:RNA-binding domain-containing protein [Collinsella sp. An268]